MRILLLSAYHSGSHRSWAEGYKSTSQHEIDLLTLPGRFWKWRMHGGSITLARRYLEMRRYYDLVLSTDMLDLTTFLALTRSETSTIPAVLYMHENQLTYPLPKDGREGPMRRQKGERDQHYSFINYASMIAADLVAFNSDFHRNSLFDALPRFLRHFPEFNELSQISKLKDKSITLPVGVDLKRLEKSQQISIIDKEQPPIIIWNQRWEYDKNPAQFFDALATLKRDGFAFRLAVCGERFRTRPAEFNKAKESFSNEIVHWGFAEEETYRNLLWEADIVVSTAIHEFFGVGVIEAIKSRNLPVLPERLSYPEIIPKQYHVSCLYKTDDELLQRLKWALQNPDDVRVISYNLSRAITVYDWANVAVVYDEILKETASTKNTNIDPSRSI